MPTLQVDSILLSYNNRKILQDVSLRCQTGEVIGILGRNGCGKSSLLKIIFGSLSPNYKYVSIDGQHLKQGYRQQQIAYLPQHNYLPTYSSIRDLARLMIPPAEWNEFSNYLVYQNNYNKTVKQVSGGELRQLEILMILYHPAPFILLDEPFTHISPLQAEDLKTLIKQRAPYKGIIVTDHQYENVLDVADRLILIQNGSTKPIHHADELITYGYLSRR